MENYVSMGRSRGGRWLRYLYLDTEELVAGSLFNRNRVRLKVDAVMKRDEAEEYLLLSVKVRKKDKEQFLKCMEELKGKMLLCGHRDYEEHGGELIMELKDCLREEMEKRGSVELPTGGRTRIALD